MINTSSVFPRVSMQMHLKGLGYHELSGKTGIEYPHLCAKMRGEKPLFRDEAEVIRRALCCDMPIEMLFAKVVDSDQRLSKSERKLINGYRSLSKEGKCYILQTLEMVMLAYPQNETVSDSDEIGRARLGG